MSNIQQELALIHNILTDLQKRLSKLEKYIFDTETSLMKEEDTLILPFKYNNPLPKQTYEAYIRPILSQYGYTHPAVAYNALNRLGYHIYFISIEGLKGKKMVFITSPKLGLDLTNAIATAREISKKYPNKKVYLRLRGWADNRTAEASIKTIKIFKDGKEVPK